MSTIAAFARCLAGYVGGCAAAAAIQVAFVLPPTGLVTANGDTLAAAGLWTLLALIHAALFAIPFAAVALAVGERLGIRLAWYYVAVGAGVAVIGFLLQLTLGVGQPAIVTWYVLAAFLASGAGGGLAYWLIAGRRAGTAATAIKSSLH